MNCKKKTIFLITALLFSVLLEFNNAYAQFGNSPNAISYIDLAIRTVWLICSVLGFLTAFRISRAFRKGRLALPWILFSSAFAVFAVSSIISFAELFKFLNGWTTISNGGFAAGVLVLIVAGYLYKKAVIR
ncbi:MAG: hypothetical protein GF307_05020 [candidate division Zixibacteria bacterium]|nr:hypothetical protein [candidate division Zixibacteria bacterium]